MAVKVGDRVSVDGIKVGQAPRTGVVLEVNEGLSGTRLLVRWDDGHQTTFSPAGGNIIIEPRKANSKGAKAVKKAAKPAKKVTKSAQKASKPAAKKKAKR